ncbi:MAG: serine/threonine-protein kinase [Steroidobacteraceae bacterium]
MPQVRAAAQPTVVGHYTLIERIGAGGQGEVWRAHDESRGVDIALKVLAPSAARNPTAWDALEREHAIASRLQHPGVLQVLPPERFEDVVVLPMELASGGDLSRLRGAGYLEIVPALLEAAEALEYAHARGVVHRDLKPGNVLFDSRGRVKLADFGIAALLPSAGAALARGTGHSPFSASPEQLRGEPPSAADDIYGLGALAYELLSGHPPYYPNFELRRVLTQPVPELVPTRQIPPELGVLIMRMLAKSAAERPNTMQQVMDELEVTLNATLSFAPGDAGTPADAGAGVEQAGSPQKADVAQTSAQQANVIQTSGREASTPPPAAPPPAVDAEQIMRAERDIVAKMLGAADRSENPPAKGYRPATKPASPPARPDSPTAEEAESPVAKTEKPRRPKPVGEDFWRRRAEAAAAQIPPAAVRRTTPPAGIVGSTAKARPLADAPAPLRPAHASPPQHQRAQPAIRSFAPPLEAVPSDDPFGWEAGHPRIHATPPPGRAQAPVWSGGGRARRWPYLLSGLLCGVVLICGAAAAALYWLPHQDVAGLQALLANVASVAAPEAAKPPVAPVSTPPPAPVSEPPAPKPQVDPAALARLNTERADFQKRTADLEARGAPAWDPSDFSAAQMQAAEASGAAAAGGIPIALQHLNQAEQLLATVAAKAPQALSAQLRTGDTALAAGKQEAASQAYALARRIDPNSQRAIDGARRAHLLNGVLPLLVDARKAESARNYSRAAQDFSQALALDPGNAVAKSGLARANAAFGDDSYARSVGAGFAALGAGRLAEAQSDFQQALRFRPQGTEASEGLQRASAAMQVGRVASLRQQAAALEAQEHWSQAAAVYETALHEDPSLAFAKRGKARDEERAQLSASLQQIIDHPDRLAFPAVKDEAVALLQQAREQTPSGPVLQTQVEQLDQLLPQLDRPVLLNVISDNATQVTIPSIGVFGSFGRREIRLKPGTYTVIGTRDGYRAVHQEFTVEPGQQSVTIMVSCSEPI